MNKKSQNNKSHKVSDFKQNMLYFTDDNGKRISIHQKASIRIITEPDYIMEYLDEDGFPMKTAEDVKDFNRRMRKIEKEEFLNSKAEYELSRWGKEVVSILEEKGEMKNADIMDELRKRGCDTSANHINKFFKSKDGRKFYKENLVGNQGYWSLKGNEKKSKTASIPIMITQKMRIELGLLGYSKDDIKNLAPIEANKIISECIINSPNSERARNQ